MVSKKQGWLGAVFLAVMSLLNIGPAAALSAGEPAPDFSAPSVLGGKTVDFSLKEALARGAVVLDFFPKAFTAG